MENRMDQLTLDKEELNMLNEFIRISIALNDEEFAYLIGAKNVSLEMFDCLSQKLYDLGCEYFYRFIEEYPEFMEKIADGILKEIEEKETVY